MNKKAQSMRILKLDESDYPEFRDEIVGLYFEAFTTGEYAQYMQYDTAEKVFDELMRYGFGNMAFVENCLAGAVVAMPLTCDADFPIGKGLQVSVDKSVYIAEVMVNTDFRGRGIASRLIENLLETLPANYLHAVIRVWKENHPAVSLYKKMGFTPIATISQTKHRSIYETFEMEKIYLHKEI